MGWWKMIDGNDKVQQKYKELVAEFSRAYPREIQDAEGNWIKVEFVQLKKDIRASGDCLKLGFVPIFQHTYMDINILEAKSEKKARLFAGSFAAVRYLPYSPSKYNAHQGSRECLRRRKQAFKKLMKDPVEFAKVLNPGYEIQDWQAEVLRKLGVSEFHIDPTQRYHIPTWPEGVTPGDV